MISPHYMEHVIRNHYCLKSGVWKDNTYRKSLLVISGVNDESKFCIGCSTNPRKASSIQAASLPNGETASSTLLRVNERSSFTCPFWLNNLNVLSSLRARFLHVEQLNRQDRSNSLDKTLNKWMAHPVGSGGKFIVNRWVDSAIVFASIIVICRLRCG